ncbi:type II toxin-antitoxin system HigB family toxin [Komagataeibacter rhaeticus]|nr:type II toxin-antitoxin system HigB family toxin [Komagataeibacter rhaeticus]
MQVIALKTLRAFWEKHPQAEAPLRAWHRVVSKAEWAGTADIREMARSADFVADNRVIFNIGGNKYRLIVRVSYEYKRVLVKFIGTHREYDKINPETV